MNLTGVSAIRIPEGSVRSVTVGGRTIWQKPDTEPYTELAYIESTGEQYIDTGIIAKSGIEIYLDYEMTKNPSKTWIMFGAHNQATNTRIYTVHTKGLIGYGNTSIGGGTNPSAGNRYDTYTKLYQWEQIFESNGDRSIRTTANATVDTGLSCYLNALNLDGEANYHYHAKIYSCRILTDGILVRDFVPVRRNSDGAIGMYDRVSDAFFGNMGTGEFIAGETEGAV